MDGFAQHDEGLGPARILKLAGVLLAALVVVAAAGAAAVVLWARTYTPLEGTTGAFAPGPGVGAAIPPAVGSGGREVFFPVYRKGRDFAASFTLHNSGHFAVTVQGLVPATPQTPPWVGPVALLSTESVSSNAPAAHTRPFRPLRLEAGDTAVVVARFRLLCPSGHRQLPSVFADSLQLRYRYLRWFSRTETVRLPFAVTLRCVGGPLTQP
ncbi:MAG TPA: hypothetical protein VFJ91_07060 [Gaiellaceae bacterium]|nr:hypothetical protein [Gaiellaceae bacterium]